MPRAVKQLDFEFEISMTSVMAGEDEGGNYFHRERKMYLIWYNFRQKLFQ